MSWFPKTNESIMEKMLEQIEETRDIVYEQNQPVNSILGVRGTVGLGAPTGGFGNTSGPQAFHPVIQIMTDIDQNGVSTGTTDRLNINAVNMIVDHPSLPLDLRFIQGTTHDGQRIFLKPKDGKTLTLKTAGNIDIIADVVVVDSVIVTLLFSEDAGDKYLIIGISSGGGGGDASLWSQFPALQDVNMAGNQLLNVGGVPAAIQGGVNFANDAIGLAWLDVAGTDELQLKVDSSDFFDFTDSGTGPVAIKLRAQDPILPDAIFSITKAGGGAPRTVLSDGTVIGIDIGVISVCDFSSAGLQMIGGLDIEMNAGQIQNLTSLVYEGFGGGIGKSITRITGGVQYDLENSTHTHTFRINGNPPIDAFEIGSVSTSVKTGAFTVKDPTSVATIDIVNQDTSPIDLDQVGELRFRADDDAGGVTENTYGRILVNMDDVSSGSKDGRMSLQVVEDNNLLSYITLNQFSAPGTIQILKDVDMNQNLITFDEQGTPSNPPPANSGAIYSKDVGTVTHPFWIDENGLETDILAAVSGEVFTWTADHSAATFDLTNLDRLRFVLDSNGPASTGDPSIFLQTNEMIFNVATANQFQWNIEDTVAFFGGNKIGGTEDAFFRVFGSNTVEANLEIENDKDTPATGNIGALNWYSQNDANVSFEYASIDVQNSGIGAGAEEAGMAFLVRDAGSPVTYMSLNTDSNSGVINMFKNVELNLNAIYFDETADNTRINGTATKIELRVQGLEYLGVAASSVTLPLGITLQIEDLFQMAPTAVTGGIDGDMWHDTVDNHVKVRTGGVEKDLTNIGAGSPLTTKGDLFTFDTGDARLPIGTAGFFLKADPGEPTGLIWASTSGTEVPIWTQNHDTDGFNLIIDQNGDSIWLNDRDAAISDNQTGLQLGGNLEYIWTTTAFQLKNLNNITFLDSGDVGDARIEYLDPSFRLVCPTMDIELTTTTGDLSIFSSANQSAGLIAGQILFDADNSIPTQKQYAFIKGRINSPTSGSEKGELELGVTEGAGVETTTYLELQGDLTQVRILKEMSMNSNNIVSIGAGTVTDLTEEPTPATGDFLFGVESGGAVRKFDVGDLPGSGGPFLALTGGVMSGDIDMNGTSDILLSVDGLTKIGGAGTDDIILFTIPGNNYVFADTSFNIGNVIQIFGEVSTPTNALANTGRLYVKDVDTTHAALFYKDELGTETNIVSTIEELNTKVEARDSGVGAIAFSIDGGEVASWTTALGLVMASTLEMADNDITGIQALGFTDAGGQILASPLSMAFTLTGASTYTFTANTNDIIKLSDAGGLVMQGAHPIDMVNNKLDNVSQIEFFVANQTITDDANGMRFSLPNATDTFDFTIDNNLNMSIEKFFINIKNSRLQMTDEVAPSTPLATQSFIWVDSTSGELTIEHNTGGPISLEGAGGGGVSFPVDPVIRDFGTTSGPLALKLDASDSGDGHSFKVRMNNNITLSFDNPPASGTQHEFEVEFIQDGIGGRTVTHPASLVEIITISLDPNTTTIITYRTNDGGTTYHAIPALRGTIDLAGGAFLPLAGGTMSGNIIMGDNDIVGLDALGFTDAGGQIIGSVALPHMNFVLTGASTFRFTANAQDILDISDASGLAILGTHNITLGNNNLTEVNQIAFDEPNQTITDSANGITISVPASNQTIDLVVNGRPFSVADGFIDATTNSLDFTNRTAPAGALLEARIYAKQDPADSNITKIGIIESDGNEVFPVGAGGGGVSNKIEQLNSKVEVLDSGTGDIIFTVDGLPQGNVDQGNGWTFDNDITLNNNAFLRGNVQLGNSTVDTITGFGDVAREWIPDGDISRSMGDANNKWATLWVRNVRFNPAATITTTALLNYVTPTMLFQVPSGEFFNWSIGLASSIEMTLTSSALDIKSNNLDNVNTIFFDNNHLIAGLPDIFDFNIPLADQYRFRVGNDATVFIDTSRLILQSLSATPPTHQYQDFHLGAAAIGTVGQVKFFGLDNTDTIRQYAEILAEAASVTSGSTSGGLNFLGFDGASIISLFNMTGQSGGKIGFFNTTPVIQQVVAGGASVATVITALKNLGLFI